MSTPNNLIQDDLPAEMIDTPVANAAPTTAAAPVAATGTPPPQDPAQPKAQAPIYVGGKKFESQDEMISYFSQLEASHAAATPAPTVPDSQPMEKELANLLFEDPAAYTRTVMEQAKKDALREIETKRAQEQVWDKFFRTNPDLGEDRDIVNLVYTMNSDRLNRMHIDQAMDELAKASRLRLNKLRQIQPSGNPLPSGPAVTTGATGNPITPPQVNQTKPMTLAEQMRAMHAKRQKA